MPWGRTTQDGVNLQLTAQTVELQSGQATMLEDVGLVSARMQFVIGLVVSELTALARLWGLPDSAVTGNLAPVAPATPTAEVLAIAPNAMGTVERTLFALGPGPASTRRIEALRARVSALGGIQMAQNAFSLPTATWDVLAPAAGNAVTITDAV
jgi:hypothetical protein